MSGSVWWHRSEKQYVVAETGNKTSERKVKEDVKEGRHARMLTLRSRRTYSSTVRTQAVTAEMCSSKQRSGSCNCRWGGQNCLQVKVEILCISSHCDRWRRHRGAIVQQLFTHMSDWGVFHGVGSDYIRVHSTVGGTGVTGILV